jgi:hypothetical protein
LPTAQIELPVGRDHEDLELAVDQGEERLEEPLRLDPEGGGNGDRVVALSDLDAFGLVESEVDRRGAEGLDRRGHEVQL